MTLARKFIARSLATALAFALAPLVACGSSLPTAQRYDHVLVGHESKVEVEILRDLANACRIPNTRAYFGFQKTELDDDGMELVDQVARCLTNGPMVGRTILVTGHTDRVGDPVSNHRVGLERSKTVAQELRLRGVPANRIFVRSRGKTEATGRTERDRRDDRKIDIDLVRLGS